MAPRCFPLLFVLSALLFGCYHADRKKNAHTQDPFGTMRDSVVFCSNLPAPQAFDEKNIIVQKSAISLEETIHVPSLIFPAIVPPSQTVDAPGSLITTSLHAATPVAIDLKATVSVVQAPEISVAREMTVKDQNPESCSNFGKLNGLKQTYTWCMLEDSHGNLWYGSEGGGLCKYDGKYFTFYTKKQGLPNNVILSLLEDRQGRIWIGTYHGLVVYDGYRFTCYTQQSGLPSDVIKSLLEDREGNIWIGTDVGALKFDGKGFRYFTTAQGLPDNTVLSMKQDRNGAIWFGTYLGGLCKYENEQFTQYYFNGIQGKFAVTTIVEDENGAIWFGTRGDGIGQFNKGTFRLYSPVHGLKSPVVQSMHYDRSGLLWIGTTEGAFRYDGNSFRQLTAAQGLCSNSIRCILEDRSGNIWLGTEGGISKYSGKLFTHFTEKEGYASSATRSIFKDSRGRMWFGTDNGLYRYEQGRFLRLPIEKITGGQTVTCLAEDNRGRLWIGTYLGMCLYDGSSITFYKFEGDLQHKTIRALLKDRHGNMWCSFDGGGLLTYDGRSYTHITTKNGLCDNIILTIYEDRQGNLWFGSYNGGACRYNGKTFAYYHQRNGLPNNSVRCIQHDIKGNIWFGTEEGICIVNPGRFRVVTEKQGLNSNIVISFVTDHVGNIWTGTRFGLSYLDTARIAGLFREVPTDKMAEEHALFKNYGYSDGFLGIGVNGGNTLVQDTCHQIWIGANDRLTLLHREGIVNDTTPPGMQLVSLDLFNETVNWADFLHKQDSVVQLDNGLSIGNFKFDSLSLWNDLPENLTLKHDNNFLTFNFIGITMNQPQKMMYRYMLEGLDHTWSNLSTQTSASYGSLPPGSYVFTVKAMNSSGIWSKAVRYAFTISPPWWNTRWFQLAMVALLVYLTFFIVKTREKKLKDEKEILEKTVDMRTAEVVKEKKTVERQNRLISQKHKEITDSINYAERIQRSFMATKDLLDTYLRDYFVFFKPKDVVSGDFYWASPVIVAIDEQQRNCFLLVTADSTGHGVPGAIMSLLNITSLETTVREGIFWPAEILNETRKIIINRLKNDGSADGGKDGMDCSVCLYDFEALKLYIAASQNSVWISRGQELLEIKADKMPVGRHDKQDMPFTTKVINLEPGDMVYTYTDGYADQFGGETGKKFMTKNLKSLLLSLSNLPMSEQKNKLDQVFQTWKGQLDQVDDVTIIGVKI